MSTLNGRCGSFLRRNPRRLQASVLNPLNFNVKFSGLCNKGNEKRCLQPQCIGHSFVHNELLSRYSLCFFHTKARRSMSHRFAVPCKQISLITNRCYSDDSKTRDEAKSLAPRSKIKAMLQSPNWPQITVDFVLRNVDPDFIAVGKDALFFIINSYIKDTELETECFLLMLLASMVEDRRNVDKHGTGNKADNGSLTAIPTSRHQDFGLLLILMRISLDLHCQIPVGKPISDQEARNGVVPAKVFFSDKLNILMGDILITSLIRLISEMENPTLLKIVFRSFSDSIEVIIRKSSSTEERQVAYYDQQKTDFDSSVNSSPEAENVVKTSSSKRKIYLSTKQEGASVPHFENPEPDRTQPAGFSRKDFGTCCEALLLNDDVVDKNVRDAARDFGLLLSQAALLQRGHVELKPEAETFVDKALSHLSCFPDSPSKDILTDVSRDFVRFQ